MNTGGDISFKKIIDMGMLLWFTFPWKNVRRWIQMREHRLDFLEKHDIVNWKQKGEITEVCLKDSLIANFMWMLFSGG